MLATSYSMSTLPSNGVSLDRESSEPLGPGETGMEIQSGRCRFHQAAPPGAPKKGAIRGKVGEMSGASRRRFMAKFASLDYAAMAESGVSMWFVTLTTPEEYWERTAFVYRALRRFRDSLEYSQGDKGYLGAFVRRELGTRRGMLHYHLVIIGGDIRNFPVQKTWARSLEYEGNVRVDVQFLDTAERVGKYLSKYCSKVAYEGKLKPSEGIGAASETSRSASDRDISEAAPLSEAHNVGNGHQAYTGGRWWYVWGEEKLPFGEVVTILGDDAKQIAKRLRRIFRRWLVEKALKGHVSKLNKAMPGGAKVWTALILLNNPKVTVKAIENCLPFARFLRRSSGGFTFLVSPDLLQRMIDAACMACSGNEVQNVG